MMLLYYVYNNYIFNENLILNSSFGNWIIFLIFKYIYS